MTTINPSDEWTGLNGTAVKLDLRPELSGFESTLAWWLLTGSWHPIWSQFVISVVHLRPIEGQPEAKLQFLDATHELLVMALDPGDPPTVHSPEKLMDKGLGPIGYLLPIDVCHQFIATDEEMIQIASLSAKACIDGHLTPSTDDNRPYFREAWLAATVKTLAHLRGEEHAP